MVVVDRGKIVVSFCKLIRSEEEAAFVPESNKTPCRDSLSNNTPEVNVRRGVDEVIQRMVDWLK